MKRDGPASTPNEISGVGADDERSFLSLIFLRGLLAQGDYLTIISQHQVSEEIDLGTLVHLNIPPKNSERPIGLTLRKDWQPTATQSQVTG